jgi:hypothetical protein
VHCFGGCDLEHILQALDLDVCDLFTSDRNVSHIGTGVHGRTRRAMPGDRPRPPEHEVHDLWARCRPLDQDRELSAWATSRGLDPFLIADRHLARALPADALVPRWAFIGGVPWQQAGYRLVLPLYDASGRIASLHARSGRLDALPKGVLPGGHAASGLVMADAGGVQMLAGGPWEPRQLWIAEGVPDFLTLVSDFGDADDETAMLGVVSGSWSKLIADRIPNGCRVVVATHDDSAGDRYASIVAATLTGRTQLFRWTVQASEARA